MYLMVLRLGSSVLLCKGDIKSKKGGRKEKKERREEEERKFTGFRHQSRDLQG